MKVTVIDMQAATGSGAADIEICSECSERFAAALERRALETSSQIAQTVARARASTKRATR